MAKTSVPNAGGAGSRRAQDPRRFGHAITPRLPLGAAWTVLLLLSLGLWGYDLVGCLVIGLGFAVGAPMSIP
jgi:hypothetical protein